MDKVLSNIEKQIYLSVLEEEVSAILTSSNDVNKNRIDIMQQANRLYDMSVQEIITYYGIDRVGEDLHDDYINERIKGVKSLNLYQDTSIKNMLEMLFAIPFDEADRDYDLNTTLEMLHTIQNAHDTRKNILVVESNLWEHCHDVLHYAVEKYSNSDDVGDEYVWLEKVSYDLGKWVYVRKEYFDEQYIVDYTSSENLTIFTHVGSLAQALHVEGRIHDFNTEDVSAMVKKFIPDFLIYDDLMKQEYPNNYFYLKNLESFFTDYLLKNYRNEHYQEPQLIKK